MRKVLVCAFSAVIATGPLLGATPGRAAESDTRPCVTGAEYRQAAKGMTKLRVHAIVDTEGRRLFINSGQVTNEAREYPVCGHPHSGGSYVQVQHNNHATNGGPLRPIYRQIQISGLDEGA